MPSRGKCSSCDTAIGVKENYFKCASCAHQCHLKCDSRYFDVKERIADVTYQHFEKLGYRWFCQDCITNVSSSASIEENKIVKEIKNLCERVESVEKILSPNKAASLSYASVTKGEERALVVTHSDKKMSSKKIAKIVQKSFDPVFTRVSDLQVHENKCVIKSTLDETTLQEFADRIKSRLGNGCEATPMKRRKPRLKIIGNIRIEENEYNEGKLLHFIKKQNDFLNDDVEIKTVKKAGANTRLTDQIIIETSPRVYNAILKKGFIIVGFTKCKVYDANLVPRCYKCSGLGHFEKNCVSPTSKCPKCAGDHKLKECKSNEIKCANCDRANQHLKQKLDINHAAYNRNCPTSTHRTQMWRNSFENEIG